MIKLQYLIFIGSIILLILLYIYHNCNPFYANKHDYYQYFQGKYFVRQQIYQPGLTDLALVSLEYPCIMKPNVFSGQGQAVKKIRNLSEAQEYIRNFNFQRGDTILIQDFVPAKYEVALLYERWPGQTNGQILSIVQRPVETNKQLLKKQTDFLPRSCTRKNGPSCLCRAHWITPALTKSIDRLIKKHPGPMRVARLDIRFQDLDSFLAGQNFTILEVNGRTGLDLKYYVPPISYLYRTWLVTKFVLRRLWIGLTQVFSLGRISSRLPITVFLSMFIEKLRMVHSIQDLQYILSQDYPLRW